jgi:AcrR family transcriptional regulator
MPVTKPARAHALPRLKARRMEICLTAAHTFAERGFDATSVNDIAAALGITKAGLYHYISSKESLLFDIITLGLDSIDEEVIEPTRGIANPEARFLDIVLRHALLATCNNGVITLLIDEVHALPQSQRRKINLRRRRYFEYVRETLRELDAMGRLQDVDPTVAAFSVIGAIMWLPQWFRPGGRLSSDEVAEEVVRLMAAGVLRPASSSRKNRGAAKDRLASATTSGVRRRLDVRAFPRLNLRRFQICMTAARTFVERGYEATSVNDVAAAVGVTKAGLYHYISSKDALFFEILTLGMDWLDEDVVKVVRQIADIETRFRETISRHAQLSAGNEPWITALLDEMHALPRADRRKIEDRKRAYFDLVRGLIRELQAAGRIRAIDPTVATYSILGMIIWIPRWFRPRRRLRAERVANDVAAIALKALFNSHKAAAGSRVIG